MTEDGTNILVVDDLPEKLLVYQSILEEPGVNLVTASSGSEALRKILRHDFAVILLDVNMPNMDGFETAELIRRRKKSAHTPIIFVTAYLDEVRVIEGYAHGAVDYILAPVAPEVLRAKVKVFVDLFRMHEQVKRQAEERLILAEERAKRAAAEASGRSSAFLVQAGTALANALDFEATLRGLARSVVPFLADLSIVSLADEHGKPCRYDWAWIDPVRGVPAQPHPPSPPLAKGGMGGSHPLAKDGTDGSPRPSAELAKAIETVLKTGKSEMFEFDPAVPAVEPSRAGIPERAIFYPDLGLAAAVVLPLAARGKILGALTLGLGPFRGDFEPHDLALARDLASRAAIALDNALLIRDIQENDRRKDEFLAMLAHELRNPLAPISNAVQVLRLLGTSQPELERARDVIHRQVHHLTRLVDDLLDVSRISMGKIRLQLEVLDVTAVVATAVETSRPLIDARRHEVSVSLPPEPIKIQADLARLAQILANLLNNAAKYTTEGGHIWLSVEREGDNAVFRIRDNGIGIPPDMLPRIFDLFTQVDQSLDRSQGGLGIGLTLVRRLVEMHHGSVQVTSAGPGQGSEFVVRLPAMSEEPRREAFPGSEFSSPVLSTRYRVLVVDDNVDTAESLAMLIRLDGHEVLTAHDGLAAIKTSQAFRPDVIFLDIGLPKLDGYEVARYLRGQPRGDVVLLAAVTGYDQEENRIRCQEAGFDHHLVKPVRLEALRRLLASPQSRATATSDCLQGHGHYELPVEG